MKDVLSMTVQELTAWMGEINQPAYRGKQLFSWLQRGTRVPEEMKNLPKPLRSLLRDEAKLYTPQCLKRQESAEDGTVKYLWQLHDGNSIETVLMRYHHGNSLCISSQVGCRMGCVFCASSLGGKLRDLTAGEMLDQVMFSSLDAGEPISNIVLMGIGEPLENYENVLRFLHLVNHPEGLNIGMRHISLSTCGLVPGIERLAEEGLPLTLSVSLHAPDNETRNRLMPINRAYPIELLLETCQRYFLKTGRRISYEYAMIDQINDSARQAELLARQLAGRGAHVNLIPLNHVEESKLRPSRRTAEFQACLERRGIAVTVRRRLGSDIDASCGQLRRKALGAEALCQSQEAAAAFRRE